MAVINNVKDFIYDFCRQYHFDQMPPEVRQRYNTYAKNEDFIGNMKFWERDLNGKPLPSLATSKLESLYNLFQAVFENMAQNQKKFAEKKGTKKFFEEWFGDGKVFNQPKPVSGDVKIQVDDFVANVLDKDPATTNQLKNIFKRYLNLPEDFDYDAFVSDVKAGKYETDPKIRDILFQMLEHAQSYSDGMYQGTWPTTLTTPYDITGGGRLDPDVNKWFKTQYNAAFAYAAPKLLKQLMDSGSLRKDFESFDFKKTISGKINDAIEATNYSDDKSDDYIPPVMEDEKGPLKKIQDSLDKIKENQINPWTNILRGTRRFFSPQAKAVVEACGKIKIKDKDGKSRPLKPTDGLKGILDNSDAIIKKVQKNSPNGKKHFEWFVKRLKVYSAEMPEAFNGALYNPRKMRKIVSQLIYDAIQDGKIDEAKTAMELLSTMKYGFFHSRTADALWKQDFVLFSDKGLYWNKYEATQILTKAFDGALKAMMVGAARGVAAVRNALMRHNTKLKGKFKKGSEADKAHNAWLKKTSRDKKRMEKHSSKILDILARGKGKSGRIITDATLATEQAYLATLTPGSPAYKDLLHDIQKYEYAINEKKEVETYEKDHQDKYMELMAHWDMLESFWKSHQFTFAAGNMRKHFLEKNGKYHDDAGKVISHAKSIQADFRKKYEQRYERAA